MSNESSNAQKAITKISNPLTIIGMFAIIAEVAGTAVLPFVTEQLQKIFIFYVMGFPVLLVLLFFWTLNKNPKVLYAPSDFSNEDNFMRLMSVIKEVDEKVKEVSEKNPEISKELEPVKAILKSANRLSNRTTAPRPIACVGPPGAKVLRELMKDPFMSIKDIAAATKLTEKEVADWIKSLVGTKYINERDESDSIKSYWVRADVDYTDMLNRID